MKRIIYKRTFFCGILAGIFCLTIAALTAYLIIVFFTTDWEAYGYIFALIIICYVVGIPMLLAFSMAYFICCTVYIRFSLGIKEKKNDKSINNYIQLNFYIFIYLMLNYIFFSFKANIVLNAIYFGALIINLTVGMMALLPKLDLKKYEKLNKSDKT